MTIERLCKYYDQSKCLLDNHFCDLDCDRFSHEKEVGLDKARDKVNSWSNEEWDRELRKAVGKWW